MTSDAPASTGSSNASRIHRYSTTAEGIRVAVFYNNSKTGSYAHSSPPGPLKLRRALATIDHTVTDYVTNARLGRAA